METTVTENFFTPPPTTKDETQAKVPARIRAAQTIMLLPLGALVVFGALMFGFIAPSESESTWASTLIGGWALIQGSLAIFVATRLPRGGNYRVAAMALMAMHLVFGTVKVVFWQETAAIPFMVLDATVIALLSSTRDFRAGDL